LYTASAHDSYPRTANPEAAPRDSTTAKVFMPSTKAILERYMAKFSKGGKVDFNDDAGLNLAPAPAPEAAPEAK